MVVLNKIVDAKITKIAKTHILVDVVDDNITWKGLVHISALSDYYVPDINVFGKVNDHIVLKIIEINEAKKTLNLDFKSINPKYLKKPFKYNFQETTKGFKSLKKWSSFWEKDGKHD